MALFRNQSPLFQEIVDPPAGGGAPPPPPAPPPPAASEFSPAQLELLGKTVNSAITSHMKRQPSIADALKGMNWEEMLTPVIQKLAPPPKADPEPGTPKQDPRLSALEAKYAELETKYRSEQTAREKAEQKSRDESAFQALRSALTGHVLPEAAESAAKILFHADRRVTFDEHGNPLMTVRKAPYQGAAEEDLQLPLADGVKHWIGTREGKLFAPPPAVQDPKRPGGAPGRHVVTGRDGLPTYDAPATTEEEKIRRANERATALAAKYPGLNT